MNKNERMSHVRNKSVSKLSKNNKVQTVNDKILEKIIYFRQNTIKSESEPFCLLIVKHLFL